MKKRIVTTTTVLATLVGIAQIASADCGSDQFTPMEQLAPEIRQQISARLLELTKKMDIDWDLIVVGVNENGEIALRAKSECGGQVIAGFSCAGGTGTAKIENPDK